MIEIDINYLKARLDYDPDTGRLFWKSHFSRKPNWNAKCAGKEALTAISNGYKVGTIDGVKCYAHRIAFAIHNGYWPEQVDHINHDRTDNRAINLRNSNPAENSKNSPRSPLNTSGATGVYFAPSSRWVARICANKNRLFLGTFDRFEDAVSARKAAEAKYGFHENHGNF